MYVGCKVVETMSCFVLCLPAFAEKHVAII